MSKDEWYSKLNKWAHEDSRLERMPLVYLRALAEHIANAQAVEQLRAPDVCPADGGRHSWHPNEDDYLIYSCRKCGARG